MITKDGKTYRNLQEQVSYLTSQYQGLQEINKVGIKVIDQVATEQELYAKYPIGFEGLEYGDAVLVGETTDFVMYVYARPFDDEFEPQWLNIGKIGIKGDKGDKGDTGERGATGESTRWYVQNSNPDTYEGYNDHDLWINLSDGSVFQLRGQVWVRTGVIRGAQGIQGPKGDTGERGIQGIQGPRGPVGDPGNFIHIAGILSTVSQLPNPRDVADPSVAYLVGAEKNLYIQVGADSETLIWTNIGQLNVATYVTVDGSFVNTWDADTKVDKINNTQNMIGLYGVGANSSDNTLYYASKDNTGNTLVMRTDAGKVKTSAPTVDDDATNKKYVDDLTKPNLIKGKDVYASTVFNASADYRLTKNISTSSYGMKANTNYAIRVVGSGAYFKIVGNATGASAWTQDNGTFVWNSANNTTMAISFDRSISDTTGIKIYINEGTTSTNIESNNDIRLLWSNSSPNSAFTNQDLSVNTGKFDYLIYKVRVNTSDTDYKYFKVIKQPSVFTVCDFSYNGNVAFREFFVRNDNTLYITSAKVGPNTANNWVIPIEIWGSNTF